MFDALQAVQAAVKKRAILVFLLIHAGLVLGIYALARTTVPNGWDETTIVFCAAVVCLYGGVVLGLAFIIWPLLPVIRRVQKADHWAERLVRDLPFFLEQLPKIVAAVQAINTAWNAAKHKDVKHKDDVSKS